MGCAVAIPEVFFEDVSRRDGVVADKITPARRKLVGFKPCSFYELLWDYYVPRRAGP